MESLPRSVQQLCTQGRIPGAGKFGKAWAIPADAEKPAHPQQGEGSPSLKSTEPEDVCDSGMLMPLMNTPFLAGPLPGDGAGHGRGAPTGHCAGGVPLFQRQAGTGGAGSGALNCSTQPIYSEFENMETLREELMAYIREHYLREDAGSYKQVALSFLHFAQREKNLFQLVYLRHRNEGETLFEDPNEMQTIHKLEVNLELPRQKAAEMHRRMQYYSYSMAVMMATGYLNFSEEEISTELTEYYRIMLSYYKQVKTEEELQHWLERSRNLLV